MYYHHQAFCKKGCLLNLYINVELISCCIVNINRCSYRSEQTDRMTTNCYKFCLHILMHANTLVFAPHLFQEHFTSRAMKLVLVSCPAGISSHGYGQCQLSGAAGLNSGYQSGHSCAKACRGAAPAVGNPARLLLCPLGKGLRPTID